MTLRRTFALLCALACSIGTAAPAQATTGPDQPQAITVTASAQVGDLQEVVAVLVSSQPGTDPRSAAQAGFAAAGLAPTVEFSTGPAVWPQFFATNANEATMVQSYNPAGDPTGGAGLAALQQAERTWTSVPDSRFHYQFGGLTTRCPASFAACGGFHLDGHNDAGWLDLGNTGVLGVTITTFFIAGPSAGAMVKADVALNTNPVVHWSTDGTGFDVQTALTHENGHAAGLGHSLNPAAVMFAFLAPGQIKRTLSLQDTTAVRFLYPQRPLVLVDRPEQEGLHRLAQLNTGSFVNDFEPGAVNDRSEAAFVADVNTGGEGVFLSSTTGVIEIVRTGGTADGLTLGAGAAGPAVLDRDGNVVFAFELDPGFPSPFGAGAALFVYDRREGKLHALVRPGVTPAPGGGVFEGVIAGRIDHSRTIAFTGVVDTTVGMQYGVFAARTDGSLELVAGPGQTLAGGTVVSAQEPSINDKGDIAFTAQLSGDPGASAFVRRGESDGITLLARSGAPIAGGGPLRAAIGPKVTDDGSVLFAGNLTVPPARQRSVGLFLATREQVVPIARPGDLMPDGAPLLTLGVDSSGWSSGGEGRVAFVATVDSAVGSLSGTKDTAIYTWSRGKLRTVIRSGNVIVGIGEISAIQSPLTAFSSLPFGGALMNSHGQVLFTDTTPFFRSSLLLVDAEE